MTKEGDKEFMHRLGMVVAIILLACVVSIVVAGTIVLVDRAMESVQ